MGPGRTHRRARMAPGRRAPEQVAETCPGRARGRPGRDPGRMTRPRRGGSPGRSHPGSWATLRPGYRLPSPCTRAAAEGRTPSGGRTLWAQREGAQAAGGGSPGANTLGSWDWHPVPSPLTALMGPWTVAGERAVFWPRWKWGMGGDTGASWGPSRAAGRGSRTLVFFLPACLPDFLPPCLAHSFNAGLIVRGT